MGNYVKLKDKISSLQSIVHFSPKHKMEHLLSNRRLPSLMISLRFVTNLKNIKIKKKKLLNMSNKLIKIYPPQPTFLFLKV